jgi:phage-related protein
VYPKVTIQTGSSGGDIQIINFTDDTTRATSFVSLSPNITLTMRGDGINYISGDYYQKFSNKNFIRLLDGENTLNITGDVKKITFEFQNRRYL